MTHTETDNTDTINHYENELYGKIIKFYGWQIATVAASRFAIQIRNIHFSIIF